MGLFDFFRKPPEPQTPDELRDALITAYTRGKRKRLSSLCEMHQQTIRESFPAWCTVPDSVRSNRQRTDAYAHTLTTVAETFKNAGFPELLRLLTGDEQSNPLLTWEEDLVPAQALIDAGDFHAAARLLLERLQKHEGHTGPGMDHFLPRTHGMLGIAHFHNGDIPTAKHHTQQALTLCQKLGDKDGVTTYSENLEQMV